jgi:hypothetical protein
MLLTILFGAIAARLLFPHLSNWETGNSFPSPGPFSVGGIQSGIFSSEHELKACLAFLFPDNQQESREYPKLFDAGSKVVRFDPAIFIRALGGIRRSFCLGRVSETGNKNPPSRVLT